jgi:hypothetical protein
MKDAPLEWRAPSEDYSLSNALREERAFASAGNFGFPDHLRRLRSG